MKTKDDIRRVTRSYAQINTKTLCESTERYGSFTKKRPRQHDTITIGIEKTKRSVHEFRAQLELKFSEQPIETNHTNVQKIQMETSIQTMHFDRSLDDSIAQEKMTFLHASLDSNCKISELSRTLCSEETFVQHYEDKHNMHSLKGILYSINSDHSFEVPMIRDLYRVLRVFEKSNHEKGIHGDWIDSKGEALFGWDSGNTSTIPISIESPSNIIKLINGLGRLNPYSSHGNPYEIKLWNVLYRFRFSGIPWLSNPKTVRSLDYSLPSFLLSWQAFRPVIDQLGSFLEGIRCLDPSRVFQGLMLESRGILSHLPYEAPSSETPNAQQTSLPYSDKHSSSIESFARPLVFHSLMRIPITFLPKDKDTSYFDICTHCGTAGVTEIENMISCHYCGELWHRFCGANSHLCPRCSVCEICGLHSPRIRPA